MVHSKFRSHLLETRLAAREGQLEMAADAAELGFWTLEPTTGELQVNAAGRQLLQSGPALSSFEVLIEAVHVEDRQRVRRAFAESLQLRRDFEIEFRIAADATRRMRCIGRPHLSTLNRLQPALSGLLQSLAAAPSTAASPRAGAAMQRLESLRELERATLVSRMKSEVAQHLAEIRQRLIVLATQPGVRDAALQAELQALADEAESGLDAVRSALFEMRPPGVAELGFNGALERHASEQAAAAGIDLALSLPATPLPVSAGSQEALFTVACAGIDNVLKHARARHMQVIVSADAEEITLKIIDDGVGIADADLMKDSAFGLFAASERLAGAGGELRVQGSPDRGTTLEARIALKQKIRPLRHRVTPLRVA